MTNKPAKFRYWTHPTTGKRTKIEIFEGQPGIVVRFTDSCSGCYEFEDGHPVGSYHYDRKVQCYIGAGCDECGYTGKRRRIEWVPLPDDESKWNSILEEDCD